MNPSGVQLAMPIVPPGRQTRSSSWAVVLVGGDMAPRVERTTSKEASGNASASASPSRKSTGRPSASALARPRSSRAGT